MEVMLACCASVRPEYSTSMKRGVANAKTAIENSDNIARTTLFSIQNHSSNLLCLALIQRETRNLQIKKNTGLFVCTQTFDVLLKLVQPAGKKIMSSHDYNLGAKIQIGEKFGI